MKTKSAGEDRSTNGPCLPDCPVCALQPEPEHCLDEWPHNPEPPDGISGICPKCIHDDPKAYHYRGDWHRRFVADGYFVVEDPAVPENSLLIVPARRPLEPESEWKLRIAMMKNIGGLSE